MVKLLLITFTASFFVPEVAARKKKEKEEPAVEVPAKEEEPAEEPVDEIPAPEEEKN